MANLPAVVREAWEHQSGPIILTTVDEQSFPNAIYVTCVALFDDATVVVADNYFDKTQQNILRGTRGSILFITDEHKAFQIKGEISYHRDGPIFEHMKSWNPKKHPGRAAAALSVSAVYSGSERLL